MLDETSKFTMMIDSNNLRKKNFILCISGAKTERSTFALNKNLMHHVKFFKRNRSLY